MGTQAQGLFLFIYLLYFCVAIIEEEDLVVGLALLAHDGGTYLAESYTMPPTLAVKDETIALALNIKSGGEQMTLTKSTTNLEFLADGKGLLRTRSYLVRWE